MLNVARYDVFKLGEAVLAGDSFDEAIGLIETVDKNAHVYVAVNGKPKHCINEGQLKDLAAHFGLSAAF